MAASSLQFSAQRPPSAGRWRERGHVAALAITLTLHVAGFGVLLHEGGDRAPAISGVESDDPQRVQLRFISAAAHSSEAGAAPAVARTAAAAAVRPAEVTPSVEPLPGKTVIPAAAPVLEVATAQPPEAVGHASLQPSATVADTPLEAAMAQTMPGDVTRTQAQGLGQAGHGHARASASPAASGGEMDWAQSVMRRLERYRNYPAAARQRRVEGVVMVQATIAADGLVLSTSVRRSCGNADLDAEALATFSRAGRVPAPPAHLPSPVRIDLPVAFALRG